MVWYNMIGRAIPVYERPMEPPDGYYDTDEEPKCCEDCDACPYDIWIFCGDRKDEEDDSR